MKILSHKKIKFIFIILILLVFSSNLFALELLVLPSKINGKDKVVLRWFPSGKADEYRIYRDGIKIATINPVTSIGKVKKILGDNYNEIKKALEVNNDKVFLDMIKSRESFLELLSFFDKDLSRLIGTEYEDISSGHRKGEKLKYKVEAFYKGRKIGSDSFMIKWGIYPDIEIPIRLAVKTLDKKAEITWKLKKGDGVLGYHLYMSEEKKGKYKRITERPVIIMQNEKSEKKKSTFKKGNYLVKNLKNGEKYFFKVTSLHMNKMESKKSRAIMVRPRDITVPLVPAMKSIKQKGRTISAIIKWNPMKNDLIIGYNLYRAKKINGKYKIINKRPIGANITEYIDKGKFAYNQVYWYRMTSIGKNKSTSPMSAALFYRPIKLMPPSKVKIISIKRKVGALEIHIKPVKDKNILRYEVMRSTSISGKFVKVGKILKNKNRYTDKKLDSRVTYCYLVRAMDKRGNLSTENRPVCARPKNKISLPPPLNFNIIRDKGYLVVSWKMEPMPLLKGFKVYRRIKGAKRFKLLVPGLIEKNKRLFFDRDVIQGKKYDYYITAIARDNIEGKRSGIITESVSLQLVSPVQQLRVYKTGNFYEVVWEYYGSADEFIVEARKIGTGKIKKIARVKKKKRYRWKKPLKGNYEISVRAFNKGRYSQRGEYRRIKVVK